MSPQSDASPQPALPVPNDDFLGDEEIDDDDDDEDENDVEMEYMHVYYPNPHQQQPHQQPQQEPVVRVLDEQLHRQELQMVQQQHQQQQQYLQQQHQQHQLESRLSSEELSRLAEVGSKFESLGVDLVRHIVLASVSSPYPAPYPNDDDDSPPLLPPLPPPPQESISFPPPDFSGVNFINLLTTDRETLTMRRLVTKALVDKSHSFNNTIFILPRIPTDVEDFKVVFGAVVDRVVSVAPQQERQQQQQQGVAEEPQAAVRDVSWGKLVTAYAFGLRLIKASIDQRRDGHVALHQQLRELMNQQPEGFELQPQPLMEPEELRQQREVRLELEGLNRQWDQHRERLQEHLEQLRRLQRVPVEEEFDANEWGAALGQVLYDRMGEWVLSKGGWTEGFNDHFLDRRGLEQVVTKKLFCAFALGIGFIMLYKLVKR